MAVAAAAVRVNRGDHCSWRRVRRANWSSVSAGVTEVGRDREEEGDDGKGGDGWGGRTSCREERKWENNGRKIRERGR